MLNLSFEKKENDNFNIGDNTSFAANPIPSTSSLPLLPVPTSHVLLPPSQENGEVSSTSSSIDSLPVNDQANQIQSINDDYQKSDTNNIRPSNEYSSVIHRNNQSKVDSTDDALEKQVQDTLNGFDVQQNIGVSFTSAPGSLARMASVVVPYKKTVFPSIIPSSWKSKKQFIQTEVHFSNLFEIYKYADRWDILLMIIGSIAAIGVGVCYPAGLIIYRRVTDQLVELGKIQNNITDMSLNVTNAGTCFVVPQTSNGKALYHAIQDLAIFFPIIGFITIFLSWIAWSCWMSAAERQVRRIRYALFRNILRQDIGWFDVHSGGELSSRLIDDLFRIKDGMSDKVPEFIALFAKTIGSIIFALIMGWKLTLVFLSLSPFVVFTLNLTVKVIIKYTIEEVKAFASASSIVQEVLQNIRTVTAFHGQAKEEKRFAENLIEAQKIGIKKGVYMGICQLFSQVFNFSACAITFWYGPQLVRLDCVNYSAGTVLVIFFACLTATLCTADFIPNIQNFAEASGSGTYVFEIIERKAKIDAMSDEGDKPDNIIGDIEFANVTFTYPARQEAPALSKLSLKIPFGKTVAFVGASGCGKSTTIQLLQRFYDPDAGQVLLDGRDIKTLNVAWLRSHIGIVSQEPVLFTGSIEENIRFGKADATDDEVQAAAKMANAHDFIMALPENYKTSSGDKLSGGQKQRVAIARALISNPKILLLDEATSALDNTSERVVQDALERVKEGRTTIVIAHRLSTIRNADLIIGLDHGEVVEYGTHNVLMKRKGLYYELVRTQSEVEKEREAQSDSDNDDDEIEKQFVRQRSVQRSFSKQSSISVDDSDQNIDDEIFADDWKTKKFCRTPFSLKILKFNAPEWPWILLGAFSSGLIGVTQPVFALFLSEIYGLFAEPNLEKQQHLTCIYAVSIFCIGIARGVLQFLSSLGFAKSGEALTMRMRKLSLAALLRQEMSYFDEEANSIGTLVTRLSSDASALKGLGGIRIGRIFQALSGVVTALIIGFSVGWKLTLVALCLAPITVLSGRLRETKEGQAGQTKDKGSFTEQGGQHATQAIEQIRTVVSLHREEHFINLYESAFNQEFKVQMCRLHLSAVGAGIANSMLFFLHTANFSYGAKLVYDGEMKFDHVFRVFAAMTYAMLTVGQTMAMMPDYTKAKIAALRIMQLNKRKSQIDPQDKSGIILDEVVGNIEFHDVRFRYPTRPTLRILRNFALTCSAGGTTALVGPSGSGKSTTIGLLQRFYDPLTGRVLLDGHDIKVLNIRWLRSLMGLVQQEPVLFNLSIRDNIAYGDNSREVTQAEIEAAARMANIHELIISLPKGYETFCGAKGSQLSGGQKQRIAIARALVRSPKILLLDEATSALDNKSEKVVQAALDKARSGRTCLSISHRLSTVRNCEKIAVVARGKMKEEGTHEQLLERNGIYAKLVSSQKRSN